MHMDANDIKWVVVLNTNSCRIYKFIAINKQLELINEFNHPENKQRDIDLTSDKQGHYQSSNRAHGSYSPSTDPKENKIDQFANEIAKELDTGRTKQMYDKLIIIAAPHMNGLLHKHINKHVGHLVSKTIEKDLLHLSDKELMDIIILK